MKKLAAVVVMSIIGLAILAMLLIVSGCGHLQPVPPSASCETACARGEELRCEWATPTTGGASCVTICHNAEQNVPWNVGCLTSTTDCGPLACP